ncbi:MAG: hypothetical protein AB2816_20895, partial [Candidatus Thiodiazotropha endolucinida]
MQTAAPTQKKSQASVPPTVPGLLQLLEHKVHLIAEHKHTITAHEHTISEHKHVIAEQQKQL